MSADFSTVLVKDDRIANLTDKIVYAVNKGAQQVTQAVFAATSESPSSCVYNIVVPSLDTIVDRHVMWTATVELDIEAKSGAADSQLVNYGLRDCLGPFPLHSLCNTLTATVNNNTVSCNMKDILAPMLRLLDPAELSKYNNTTPVAYDTYRNYADMSVAGISTTNNVFNGYNLVANGSSLHPRGSFAIDAIAADAAFTTALPPVANNATGHVYVRFTVSEPLMLSPFLFTNNSSNNQGMYGVQNMSFNMNLNTAANRVWRHVDTAGATGKVSTISGVTVTKITNSNLTFNFLSAHPSDFQNMSSRCVVPYYELPRYITPRLDNIAAVAAGAYVGARPIPATKTYSSSTISLNQIPDKLIICVRKPSPNWTDSDSFLPITKININWNNNSGVCSSFTQDQLWRCSVDAGSNQTWDEFRGFAFRPSGVGEATDGAGAGRYVPTVGSVLALDVGRDLNIIEEYYAAGSIGSFNLQFSVTCENWGPQVDQPELVLICMNSGSFACERGTSATFTALLTKEDVLATSMQEAVARSDVKRLVGGGFLDSLKSAFKWLLPRAGKLANTGLQVYDIVKGGPSEKSTKAREVVKALGGARSGGAMSGGLMGRLK
jgi:hypothetical protein